MRVALDAVVGEPSFLRSAIDNFTCGYSGAKPAGCCEIKEPGLLRGRGRRVPNVEVPQDVLGAGQAEQARRIAARAAFYAAKGQAEQTAMSEA